MILIVNPGSSSLKYKLFKEDRVIRSSDYEVGSSEIKNHAEAIKKLLDDIQDNLADIEKIGIRVVHGGEKFSDPVLINKEVVSEISRLSELAPLHNPPAITSIKYFLKKLPQIPVYAVFDTSFFADLPEENKIYAIPKDISSKFGIKRYGFHGISHNYVSKKVDPNKTKKVISIHLGAGCSIAAIDKGSPVATSMGMTPLEGLVMQSRSGNIDPGVILLLVNKLGHRKTKNIIENESGLKGLTQSSGAMIDILKSAGYKLEGQYNNGIKNIDPKSAQLALKIYTNKIKEYIGSYAALLGGVDILAFSGKIGFNSSVIRDMAIENLNFMKFSVEVVEPNEEQAIMQEIVNLR